jgi:glutamyl-Q tRNA(Asp) synthetase
VPVVRNANGEKLSKQTGALAILPGSHDNQEAAAVAALRQAAGCLGLHSGPAAEGAAGGSLAAFWQEAVPAWAGLLAERGATLAASSSAAS